jgi:hypothetical protein
VGLTVQAIAAGCAGRQPLALDALARSTSAGTSRISATSPVPRMVEPPMPRRCLKSDAERLDHRLEFAEQRIDDEAGLLHRRTGR